MEPTTTLPVYRFRYRATHAVLGRIVGELDVEEETLTEALRTLRMRMKRGGNTLDGLDCVTVNPGAPYEEKFEGVGAAMLLSACGDERQSVEPRGPSGPAIRKPKPKAERERMATTPPPGARVVRLDELEPTFWNRGFGRAIRWLAFLPIGLGLAFVLELIPVLAWNWAQGWKPEWSFVTIVLKVVAASLGMALFWLWCRGVMAALILTCRHIAPNHKRGALIFGAVFVVDRGVYLWNLAGVAPWLWIAYAVVFTLLGLFAAAASYSDEG